MVTQACTHGQMENYKALISIVVKLQNLRSNIDTCKKATRRETLMTVTTINFKITHFDILPQFIIDGL